MLQPWWLLATNWNATFLWLAKLYVSIHIDKTEIYHHIFFWYQFLRNHKLTLALCVTNCNWDHLPCITSLRYKYHIVNVPTIDNHPFIPHKSQSLTWTGRDPPCPPQNRNLKRNYNFSYQRRESLALSYRLYFSLIKHHNILHNYWNPWKVQWIMVTNLEYLPEQRHLRSQYLEYVNLEYNSKSTPTLMCLTGSLENTS